MNEEAEKEFNSYAELSVFSAAQHETITKLNFKINQLQEKATHLEKLLAENSIIVGDEQNLKDMFLSCSDPEAISRCQLKLLRDRAIQQELSMEECKRVEIYSKIIDTVELKKKDRMKNVTESKSDAELLMLLKEPDAIKQLK